MPRGPIRKGKGPLSVQFKVGTHSRNTVIRKMQSLFTQCADIMTGGAFIRYKLRGRHSYRILHVTPEYDIHNPLASQEKMIKQLEDMIRYIKEGRVDVFGCSADEMSRFETSPSFHDNGKKDKQLDFGTTYWSEDEESMIKETPPVGHWDTYDPFHAEGSFPPSSVPSVQNFTSIMDSVKSLFGEDL